MTDLIARFVLQDLAPPPLGAALRWLREAARGLRERWDHHVTQDALEGLDDLTLKDLGVDRSEITSVVHDTSGDRRRRYDGSWRAT